MYSVKDITNKNAHPMTIPKSKEVLQFPLCSITDSLMQNCSENLVGGKYRRTRNMKPNEQHPPTHNLPYEKAFCVRRWATMSLVSTNESLALVGALKLA
jgi:hypothetical protein